MGCKVSQWRKSPNFWDEMWYLLRHTCWVIKSFASVLLCGPHISWPHISWPLVGQLQIMSQFLLVEKADDLNSELKRDYSNGQYKLLTPSDTDSFNTTPPSQWGTATSDLSLQARQFPGRSGCHRWVTIYTYSRTCLWSSACVVPHLFR